MGLHKITDITEADFGCEEHNDGPHAVIIFEDGTKREVSEQWISENKIEEGKYVWIKEDNSIIKAINVVAAVIRHGDKIFATQRGYGEFKDKWEFPGGKVESGEDPKAALVREIKEELTTEVEVGNLIKTVESDYPEFHITMHVYWCDIVKGELTLLEHEAAKWVEINDELPKAVDWLPADLEVVNELLEEGKTMMNTQIIEYYECADKEHWLSEIAKSDWRAGQLLYELIRDDKLKGLCGANAKVLLLVEGEKLISYCTYVEQDEIDAPEIKPWIGFVYTFPEYRGQRLFGNLVDYACALAKEEGYDILYVSTDAIGIYEKYGFVYWKSMQSIYEWTSRVYRKNLQ